MRCVLEKSGVASPASQFNAKRTAEIFPQIRDVPEDDIVKIATECTDIRKFDSKKMHNFLNQKDLPIIINIIGIHQTRQVQIGRRHKPLRIFGTKILSLRYFS